MLRQKGKLISYFSEQESRFHRQSAVTLRNPSPKNVHDLRVTLRRLFTVFWLAEHSSDNLSLTELSKPLIRLFHNLGQLRELDVAIVDANKFHFDPSHMKIKRRQLLKKVRLDFKLRDQRELFGFLQMAHDQMNKNPELDLKPGNRQLGKKLKVWIHKGVSAGRTRRRSRCSPAGRRARHPGS